MRFLRVSELRQQTKDFLTPTTFDRCIGVTLTMKQKMDFVRLDEERSSQNFRHFLNLLNREVFGKRFTRFGTRINVIPVLEVSNSHRLHYHTIFQVPKNIRSTDFLHKVEDSWKKTDWGYEHFHHHNHIDEGWLDYLTKFRSYRDQIDWINHHWVSDRWV